MTGYHPGGPTGGSNLVDILDRVLDKGLVVAGDIRVSLANVELLTIRIRLLVCSIDKAEQIGLNWWRYDQSLVKQPEEALANAETVARLEARIAELETQLARRAPADRTAAPARGAQSTKQAGQAQRRTTRRS